MTLNDFLDNAGIANAIFAKHLSELAALKRIDRRYNRIMVWKWRNGTKRIDPATMQLIAFLTCGRVMPNDFVLCRAE